MPKYSRTETGQVIEHFDSLEELEKRERELPIEGSYLGCFLLVIASGLAAYFAIYKLGFFDIEKWLKATLIATVVIPSGVIGYKYGEMILGFIYLALFALIAFVAGSFLWRLL